METVRATPVRPGEPAPDFTLPSAQHEETVALASYRGQRAVLLVLYRGLYCPFCRRHIAQLDAARERLAAVGIEPVAVFATPPERSRLYFRARGFRIAIGADGELRTHRAYGIPAMPVTPQLLQVAGDRWQRMARELGVEPPSDPHGALLAASRAYDGYEQQPADMDDFQRHQALFVGHFLIDRDGVVRWAGVDHKQGIPGLASHPSLDELVALASLL